MSTEPSTPLIVTLTSWEWHALLNDLEEHMRIVNRDRRNTIGLYEAIASQLAGHPVRVRRPEPPKAREPESTTPTPRASWWSRFTGRRCSRDAADFAPPL